MLHFDARAARRDTSHQESCRAWWIRLALVLAASVAAIPAAAQWSYRAPNVPRTAAGAVDVRAPTPRTADGRVDLSGVWQTDSKYNFNLAADLKPEDIPMLPAAR